MNVPFSYRGKGLTRVCSDASITRRSVVAILPLRRYSSGMGVSVQLGFRGVRAHIFFFENHTSVEVSDKIEP